MVFEACRSSPFTPRRYLPDGDSKDGARAQKGRAYTTGLFDRVSFLLRAREGKGASAMADSRNTGTCAVSVAARPPSLPNREKRRTVAKTERYGGGKEGVPRSRWRALLIFCHCKLIYSMGPGIIPCGPRIVRALWGPDTFRTKAAPRSLFASCLRARASANAVLPAT